MKILLPLLLTFSLTNTQAQKSPLETVLPCDIIYQLDVNALANRHGQDKPVLLKYALVKVCELVANDSDPLTKIPIEWNGYRFLQELTYVMKIFDSEEDALVFAEMNHVPMTWLKDDKTRLEYVPSLRENGKLPNDLRADWVLQYLETKLPQDWEMVMTEAEKTEFPRTFTIQAKYTALRTRHNLINAPMSAIQDHNDTAFMKKNGEEFRPLIRFELHQPWRAVELRNVDYQYHPPHSFFANTQYFGLKIIEVQGLTSQNEQVLLPKNAEGKPFLVYEMAKAILSPQTFSGTAENAKMGAALIAADGSFYLIDDRRGDWYNWPQKLAGKKVSVKGILVPRQLNTPLVNLKGEYMSGAAGDFDYIINAELERGME